jgi:hypothetical protein
MALVIQSPQIFEFFISISLQFRAHFLKIYIKNLPCGTAPLPQEDGNPSRKVADVLVVTACNARKNLVDEGS